jgi:predicted Zn-dependent protease
MSLRLWVIACSSFVATAQTVPQSTPQKLFERGQQYWHLSLEAYDELQKIAPESAYALALLGEDRAKKRQYTPALDALTEAAKRMPELRGAHSAMADIYAAEGKPSEAGAAEAAERKLGPPNCALEKLQCDFSAGRFEDVVKAAKLKQGPERLYWRARGYQELALQSFAELDKLPESAELHKVRAQLLRQEHKYSQSIDEWRAALKLAPTDRNIQRELATALFLSEDYRGMLPELQQLLKAQPDSANLNFFVGDSLLETEQTEEAVPYLETAVRRDPKLVPAHVSLGLCYVRLNQPEKAIRHLKMGLPLDKNGRLYYLLARAYGKTGQPELAKAMMDKYQEIQRGSGR